MMSSAAQTSKFASIPGADYISHRTLNAQKFRANRNTQSSYNAIANRSTLLDNMNQNSNKNCFKVRINTKHSLTKRKNSNDAELREKNVLAVFHRKNYSQDAKMFVNVSCVKRRPKEETESKENSGLNIQKIKSIRRKLFKGYSNKEGISKQISALKKSLSIKKISYSPKKSWEKPQYCNNWGDTRDFETKKSKLDNTFINEFGNDYAQGSFQGHTGSSFGHKK